MYLVLIICGVIFYQKENLDKKRIVYQEQKEELQQEIDAETEYAEELEERRAYVQTKKYVEEVAREKLGLVYKDEIIFEPEK
ncbi:septum formation initiator family protein [Anaerosporobacter sp.]|uniref:septum formation initiator family protein n=1 Tax=Anaerosporobacter sp. TaxID=1872529 RepID=UPI00286F2EC7|nr:septum formation initiator family protein [Anaerosporobacter sp.]